MSRRSVVWRRKARQAGGGDAAAAKLLPRHAVGRGTWQKNGPCVANGNRRSGIVGDGAVCTRDITAPRAAVVRRAVVGK